MVTEEEDFGQNLFIILEGRLEYAVQVPVSILLRGEDQCHFHAVRSQR